MFRNHPWQYLAEHLVLEIEPKVFACKSFTQPIEFSLILKLLLLFIISFFEAIQQCSGVILVSMLRSDLAVLGGIIWMASVLNQGWQNAEKHLLACTISLTPGPTEEKEFEGLE